jgi:hypothetical protein
LILQGLFALVASVARPSRTWTWACAGCRADTWEAHAALAYAIHRELAELARQVVERIDAEGACQAPGLARLLDALGKSGQQ